MRPREYVGLVASILALAYLIYLLWRMTSHRRRDRSATDLLLAGPILFLRPQQYFPEGKLTTPWRFFVWWIAGATTIAVIAHVVARWAESRVAI